VAVFQAAMFGIEKNYSGLGGLYRQNNLRERLLRVVLEVEECVVFRLMTAR